MRILGIDPGKATGIAVFNTETLEAEHLEIVEMGERDLVNHIGLLTFKYMVGKTVYESFIPRWGQAFDCTPMYLIGAMNAMGREWMKVKPAEHKSIIKDAPLNVLFKKAGEKIAAGHSRDALRLCLYVAVAKMRDAGSIRFIQENK